MVAQRPEELHPLFAKTFTTGDLDGIMALYEKGAGFLRRSGRLAKGTREIREVYRELFASKGKFEVETKKIVQAEDLALMIGRWTFTASGAAGKPATRSGVAVDVARRQPDGMWLIVIDSPYGVE